MKAKHHYYAYIFVVLAAGMAMIIGRSLDAAITLQPGEDPAETSRKACDPSLNPYSSSNENAVNKYLCCEAACRSYCGFEPTCASACIPVCT